MRRLMLLMGTGAMLAGSVPAVAQDRRPDRQQTERRDDRRHGREYRRRGRSDAAGAFVVGALAVGLLAGLSSRRARSPSEVIAEPAGFAPAAAETDVDAAVSACAMAVEGEGQRTFALAQTGQVRAPVPSGQGYAVEGDVLLRGHWREPGERRGFRCTVDAQAVRTVTIDGLMMLPPR